jgi:hypothetical protein
MSFLEIYKEEVYDLLTTKGREKMEVKEDKDRGVFVKDLNNFVVKTFEEMMKVLYHMLLSCYYHAIIMLYCML